MFESIDIRKVANGYLVSVTTEDETKEYVFDTGRKVMRFIKTHIDANGRAED